MEHNPDPAIFEDEPEPAMRRAGAALAAARAHARDPEVIELLSAAAALLQCAHERQLGQRERPRPASGVFPVQKREAPAEPGADPVKRSSRWNP